MGPVTYIAAGASLGLMVMTGLYLDKRDDLTQAIADCNLSKLQEVVEAKEAVRVALEDSHKEKEREWQDLLLAKEGARAEAATREEAAVEGTVAREARITQLTLEAENEELPDSVACLNAFVPWAALDWMQHPREDCSETGDSADSGADQICSDSGGFNRDLLSPTNFSSITYGDMSIIWGRDRDSLEIMNGRALAIRHLSDALVDQQEEK